MNTPEDPIEKLLREQETYVEDSGFTARVLTNLPRRRLPWARPLILLGAAAIGAVLAWHWLPWSELPPLDFAVLFSENAATLTPWVVVFAVLAALALAVRTAVQAED